MFKMQSCKIHTPLTTIVLDTRLLELQLYDVRIWSEKVSLYLTDLNITINIITLLCI